MSAPRWALAFKPAVSPVKGGSPRSTRSRLTATKSCCATVREEKPPGNTMTFTPSAARALSMACSADWMHSGEPSRPEGAHTRVKSGLAWTVCGGSAMWVAEALLGRPPRGRSVPDARSAWAWVQVYASVSDVAVTARTAARDVPPLSLGSLSPVGSNDAPMTRAPPTPTLPKLSRIMWRSAHPELFSYIHWYTASRALATAPIHSVLTLR